MKKIVNYYVHYTDLEKPGTWQMGVPGAVENPELAIIAAKAKSFKYGVGAEVWQVTEDTETGELEFTPVFMVHGADVYKLVKV